MVSPMSSRFVIVGEAPEAGFGIDPEEFLRLQAEVAVLRDAAAALAADRDRLRAETKKLRANRKRAAVLKAVSIVKAKKRPAGKRGGAAPPVMLQYGALPYRVTGAGSLELLLVTTRQSKRWIIPKGRRIKGLKPAKCAAREAFEEAGVRGSIEKKSIGAFRFLKTVDDALAVMCEVRIFPLKVKRQMRQWPEAPQRTPRWFEPSAALEAVNDAGLKSLISRFVETMAPAPLN
jgi:8-oxo-dGTP pyrophosphatase MutT (NUDIX family)